MQAHIELDDIVRPVVEDLAQQFVRVGRLSVGVHPCIHIGFAIQRLGHATEVTIEDGVADEQHAWQGRVDDFRLIETPAFSVRLQTLVRLLSKGGETQESAGGEGEEDGTSAHV